MTQPAFQKFLPFCKPSFPKETFLEIENCLDTGWITTGPKVKAFEQQLADYHQSPYAITTSSATAGLHISLLSLDLQPGDEVITTAFTFVSTLNTIVLAQGKPVLVDVDTDTFNLSLDQVEQVITHRTKAIVPVHFAGAPLDMDRLYALAHKHNLRIIEDAAHAIGAEYKGKKIGSFGDTQVFSFHPNKNITTIEGGCIITRDETLAKKVRALKFHGIDREAWNRFSKEGSHYYDVLVPGFKYNMSDISAAMGRYQLPLLDSFIEKREKLALRYEAAFKDWEKVQVRQSPGYLHKHAWNLFNILLCPAAGSLNRDDFSSALKEENIGVGVHWQAPHLFSFYKKWYKKGDFPHAEHIADHIVSLPLFPSLTFEEQDKIIDIIYKVLNR